MRGRGARLAGAAAAIALAVLSASCSRSPDRSAHGRMTPEQVELLTTAGVSDFDPRGTLAAALQRVDDRTVRDLLLYAAGTSPATFQQIRQLRPEVRFDGVNRAYNDSPALVEALRSSRTPAALAATVPALLAGGAGVNDADGSGLTPLLAAAGRGDPATVQLLLKAGADVAAADHQGRTVLHHAALNPLPELIQMLLQHGAAAAATDRQRRTVLHVLASAARADRATAAALIAAGTPFDTPDAAGARPLDIALEAGRLPLVELLLQAGATVNRDDGKGYCPLLMAMVQRHAAPSAAVELLLRFGADPDYKSRRGPTPRIRATHSDIDRSVKALFHVE